MKTTYPLITVITTVSEKIEQAQQLAAQLGLDFIPNLDTPASQNADYLLILNTHHLALQKLSDPPFPAFHIDFLSGKMRYRCQQASLRKELLARALGVKPRQQPFIVDATAGLGRDSFILATLGFHITLIERSPVLHALLQDALKRANTDPETAAIANRLHLIQGEAGNWLKNTSQKPDIITLDPMFPERQKSASVKKEMVILQDLLGKDEDAIFLLELALTCATHRVVVKRPRLAPRLGNRVPSFSLTGQSSRFDIYLTKR